MSTSSRYNVKRTCINWYANDWLKILKMLAWAVTRKEPVNKWQLWKRLEEVYPRVVELITGEKEISFKRLREHTLAVQGKKITPDKVYQRADKTERYGEFNLLKEAVVQSYLAVAGIREERDSRHDFSDAEVLEACKRQDHKCITCQAVLNALNPPQGDHIISYSKGGRTVQDNCGALCVGCNEQKKDLDIIDFVRKLGMKAARGRSKIYED